MILELMRKRRSIRRFTPDPPPDEILLKLVEAAVTAPSASNKQPWRFLIVKSKERIAAAVRRVEEERRRLSEMMDPEYLSDYENYAEHFTVFGGAPALIVPIYRCFTGLSGILDEHAGEEYRRLLRSLESQSAVISVSLAMQNLLLMARELEIGACCTTGPLIAGNRLADCFEVPEGWRILAVIAVGRPAEAPENPGRKPLKSVVKWL